MRRLLIVLSVSLALPASLSMVVPAASAAPATATVVTCLKFSGSLFGSASLAVCNDKTVADHSGAVALSASTRSFSISWRSGKTSTGTFSYTIGGSTCPSTNPIEAAVGGAVTGGTATTLIGGTIHGTLCANGSGDFELQPGSNFKI